MFKLRFRLLVWLHVLAKKVLQFDLPEMKPQSKTLLTKLTIPLKEKKFKGQKQKKNMNKAFIDVKIDRVTCFVS
jgi:hypothetical protein